MIEQFERKTPIFTRWISILNGPLNGPETVLLTFLFFQFFNIWHVWKIWFLKNDLFPLFLGNVTSGLPPFKFPNITSQIGNQTYTFFDMCSHLGSGLIIVPLVAVLTNVAIAKAFGMLQMYIKCLIFCHFFLISFSLHILLNNFQYFSQAILSLN